MAAENGTHTRENAVGQVYLLAQHLVLQHPEIAQVYASDPSIIQKNLAKMFLPEEFAISPRVTEAAVQIALKELLGVEALSQLAQQRQAAERQRRADTGFYQTDAFKAQTQRASAARHAHSTEEDKRRLAEALALAKGDALWSDDEVAYLIALLQTPDFYFKNERIFPDYIGITEALNQHFGSERSMIAVRGKIYRLKAEDQTILLQ